MYVHKTTQLNPKPCCTYTCVVLCWGLCTKDYQQLLISCRYMYAQQQQFNWTYTTRTKSYIKINRVAGTKYNDYSLTVTLSHSSLSCRNTSRIQFNESHTEIVCLEDNKCGEASNELHCLFSALFLQVGLAVQCPFPTSWFLSGLDTLAWLLATLTSSLLGLFHCSIKCLGHMVWTCWNEQFSSACYWCFQFCRFDLRYAPALYVVQTMDDTASC